MEVVNRRNKGTGSRKSKASAVQMASETKRKTQGRKTGRLLRFRHTRVYLRLTCMHIGKEDAGRDCPKDDLFSKWQFYVDCHRLILFKNNL